jgi:hypothetical protein
VRVEQVAGVRRRDYAAENLGLGLTAIPDPLVHINYPTSRAGSRSRPPGLDQAELSEIITTGRRMVVYHDSACEYYGFRIWQPKSDALVAQSRRRIVSEIFTVPIS